MSRLTSTPTTWTPSFHGDGMLHRTVASILKTFSRLHFVVAPRGLGVLLLCVFVYVFVYVCCGVVFAPLCTGGMLGIRTIGRMFRIMDDSGDHKLSRSELTTGLHDYGLTFTPDEFEALWRFLDRDRSGTIDYDEFLRGVKGALFAPPPSIAPCVLPSASPL